MRENRNNYLGEGNYYEELKHYRGDIPSGLRRHCIVGNKCGPNLGGNGSSRCNLASGKSIDWSWVGQFGKGTFAGERFRPELRQYCRNAPGWAGLGQDRAQQRAQAGEPR